MSSPTKILGKISTFTPAEQFLLICHYDKCRAYQSLWRISANVYDKTHTFYVLFIGITTLAMSILTQMFQNDSFIRDINTVVSAIVGFTIGLMTKSETFNYIKMAESAIDISDQFRDLAVKINKNLVASVPDTNAYHTCIDEYTTMEAKEHNISWIAKLWAFIHFRNTDPRSLPAILGGTHIILPDAASLDNITEELDNLIQRDSESPDNVIESATHDDVYASNTHTSSISKTF